MSYSAAEHRILAEVERKAGSIPPGVKNVVDRRRSGGTYEELQKLAQEELKGSLVARAAVLQWLDEEFAPKVDGTPGPGQPVVKPLTK